MNNTLVQVENLASGYLVNEKKKYLVYALSGLLGEKNK